MSQSIFTVEQFDSWNYKKSIKENLKNKLNVKFWKNSFSTSHILNWKFFGISDSEFKKLQSVVYSLNFFRYVRFWEKVCNQGITFRFFLLRQDDSVCIFCAFSKNMISTSKLNSVSHFERDILQRVSCSINYFKTCSILKWITVVLSLFGKEEIYNVSDFDFKFLRLVSFWSENSSFL